MLPVTTAIGYYTTGSLNSVAVKRQPEVLASSRQYYSSSIYIYV
jgi:hypothetical protein